MRTETITPGSPNSQVIGHRLVLVPFTLKEGVKALKERATSLCASDITKVWGLLDEVKKNNLITHIKNKGEASKLIDWLTDHVLFRVKDLRAKEHLSRKIPVAVPSKKIKELARDIISRLQE